MDDTADLFEQGRKQIAAMGKDAAMRDTSHTWMDHATRHSYGHHFTWMGRPIIQLPQDIIAMQELIFRIKPARIVETGVARGGSLIFYASMLELLGSTARVVGVDIDIRPHNRKAIEEHPMAKRIDLIQGSSIDEGVVRQVYDLAADHQPVLVVLDSNHTHEHVLAELRAYAPLVKRDSYLVVFDTAIDVVGSASLGDRPWGPGNNPRTAVHAFLKECGRFEIDASIHNKLQITVAPDGYLRCISDE